MRAAETRPCERQRRDGSLVCVGKKVGRRMKNHHGDHACIKIHLPDDDLSIVFDQRILDGASADWFLAKVKETLENWA